MKPGRKPIPRAERLRLGLPVCAVDGCDRAPTHAAWCKPCYLDAPHRRPRRNSGVPMVQVNHMLPEPLALALKAEAKRRSETVASVLEEALSEAVRRWGVTLPSSQRHSPPT